MFKLTTLNNGLSVIAAPMKGTKTATVLVMVGTGSKYESKNESGLSHFLEHMFFKGTKKRPTTLALSSELDAIGAEFNAFTGKEYTGYWVKADAAKLPLALDVVCDMLTHAKLQAAQIEREKGVIIEEINMYRDNPIMLIEDVFEQRLYGDTPAGRDTIGTKENIRRFKRADFTAYLNRQYGLNNTTVILAGNIGAPGNPASMKEAGLLVRKYFRSSALAGRGRDFRDKEPVKEAQTAPACLLHYKKTDQAHLCLGVRAYGYADKKRAALKLLSLILGGSMSSRLFIGLRERLGLAYYVRTDTESYTDAGYLATRAGVPVDKLEQAIGVILREYRALKNRSVSPAELRRAKDMLFGRMAIQFEASDSLANWYGRQAALLGAVMRVRPEARKELKIQTPEDYRRELKRVTAADIRSVAREIFKNEKLNLAVIGPYRDGRELEKLLKL